MSFRGFPVFSFSAKMQPVLRCKFWGFLHIKPYNENT